MASTPQQHDDEESPGAHWRVWSTANVLEKDGLSSPLAKSLQCQELTQQVVAILRKWAKDWAGIQQWQSFLNKSSLQHEVEESIVALNSLLAWMKDTSPAEPITVVDCCCGKGVFSVICSYVFQGDERVRAIVMFDKAKINWQHVEVANESYKQDKRPRIITWEQCNLHEHDKVLDRLEALEGPLALVGIHLCKHLSPACVGLVNGLGPDKCPFLCLAPCCLPRLAACKSTRTHRDTRSIQVPLYESPSERSRRRDAMKRRAQVLGRGKGVSCYLCQSTDHLVRECHLLPDSREDRISIWKEAQAATVPCWRCGELGHYKANCPSTQSSSRPIRVAPPMSAMNVSQVLESDSPFDTYCGLLTETIQRSQVLLIETGLTNDNAQHDTQSDNNWNSNRKSIYIVAT